jgi:hypothetical protein
MDLIVVNVRRTPRVQKFVISKVDSGECLLCNKPPFKRQLCKYHAGRFDAQMRKLSGVTRKRKFEAELARAGHVLLAQEVREIKRRRDPFVKAARKVAG